MAIMNLVYIKEMISALSQIKNGPLKNLLIPIIKGYSQLTPQEQSQFYDWLLKED